MASSGASRERVCSLLESENEMIWVTFEWIDLCSMIKCKVQFNFVFLLTELCANQGLC